MSIFLGDEFVVSVFRLAHNNVQSINLKIMPLCYFTELAPHPLYIIKN